MNADKPGGRHRRVPQRRIIPAPDPEPSQPPPPDITELEALARPDCDWCEGPAELVLIIHQAAVALWSCPGEAIFLACPACLRDVAQNLAEDIAKRVGRLAHGHHLECRCGRVVRQIHDVLEIEKL